MSRPKPGDLIADKYQIERFIGQGGMAEVFAGLNIRTGKRVALKWISPALATTKEALARFRREALAAGRINHPNVVTVFDVVEHASSTWLVMELLEGNPLSEILNRVGYMEAEPAVQLLIPAIRGVAAAHAHGVIHRDLTPDNIFICRSADGKPREAKVLDFGVSKLADDSGDQVGITGLGHAVGTPAYMAPEQVRGHTAADARTDVYALGVVLYQMLAGRRPFDGQVYSALMIEIATAVPPPLRSVQPHVPVALEAIVARAMAREMDQRFPDVKSLLEALEDLVRVDVSYAQNKISGAHSGRVASADQMELMDSSHSGRVISYPTPTTGEFATARLDANRNPMMMMAGPATPPLGSPPVGDDGDAGGRWTWYRIVPVLAATALVCAVVALAVIRARHDSAREEVMAIVPPRPIAPPRAEPPTLNQLVVMVTPTTAKIVIDGVAVDGNPFTGRYRRDQLHQIAASATGFEPKTQEVALAKDLVVTLTLDRRRPAALAMRTVAARRGIRESRHVTPGSPLSLPTEEATAFGTAPPAPAAVVSMPYLAHTPHPPAASAPAPASPSASFMAVDPAGGRAPIHPIQTISPYEAP